MRRATLIFNSASFAIFLPLVLIVYWPVPKRFQNLVLLTASYVFYGWWDWRFLSLLIASTVVDFLLGQQYPRVQPRNRVWLLRSSVIFNLGILGVFKYFNFFVDSAGDALQAIGFEANRPFLMLVLPVGISFYTFQTISYSFDLYRGRIEPCRSIVDFATFVAFFPQLVAGPIERAQNLMPQITTPRVGISNDQLCSAVSLFLFGLFKKVAIADMIAPVVDRGFDADPTTISSGEAVVAIVGFSIQIYADFSGYTDMARGVSRLLNIELMRNFEQPYLSRSITEFWQRWHISLSTWLRDYLYIPLGGNRRGTLRTYRNLMITMLLGGLWHGAGANFVIWGGLHGLALAAHRARTGHAHPAGRPTIRDIPRIVGTFGFVTFAWIFFRSPSLERALDVLGNVAALETHNLVTWDLALVVGGGIILLTTDLLQRFELDRAIATGRRPALAGALSGIAVLAVVVASGGEQTPFIYFQF